MTDPIPSKVCRDNQIAVLTKQLAEAELAAMRERLARVEALVNEPSKQGEGRGIGREEFRIHVPPSPRPTPAEPRCPSCDQSGESNEGQYECDECGQSTDDKQGSTILSPMPSEPTIGGGGAGKVAMREIMEASPPGAPAGKERLGELWRYIEAMIAQNVSHRTKGFRLGDATMIFAATHLQEESQELFYDVEQGSSDDSKRAELADVLGVVIHLAILLKETPDSIAARELEKLKLRFEIPAIPAPAEQGEGEQLREEILGNDILGSSCGEPRSS